MAVGSDQKLYLRELREVFWIQAEQSLVLLEEVPEGDPANEGDRSVGAFRHLVELSRLWGFVPAVETKSGATQDRLQAEVLQQGVQSRTS